MKKIDKSDFPVYLFYFIMTFCKGIDLTKDSKIYIGLYILGIFLLIIRIFKQDFNLKQIILVLSLLSLGAAIYYYGKNTTPLFSMIAICSLKDINVKSILKMIFWVHLSCFIMMIFLSTIGIIENKYIIHAREAVGLSKRYFFGYTHPNLVQMHLLSITILYYYLYGKNCSTISYVFWILFNFIIFYFSASRTSFYLSIIFLISHFIFKKYYLPKKIFATAGKYSFIVMFVFTFFLASTYRTLPFTKNIDRLLTGRVYYLDYLWNNYSFKLIGQKKFDARISLDNSYFGMLYQGGILLTIVLLIINYITCTYLYKNKKYDELWFMLFLNLMCFTENFYLVPIINFMLLISSSILFEITSSKSNKEDKV